MNAKKRKLGKEAKDDDGEKRDDGENGSVLEEIQKLRREIADLKQQGGVGLKRQSSGTAGFRLICPECIEAIDVAKSNMSQMNGIGAGYDYDGTYDSGSSQVRFDCPRCKSHLSFGGCMSDHIGKTWFKISM